MYIECACMRLIVNAYLMLHIVRHHIHLNTSTSHLFSPLLPSWNISACDKKMNTFYCWLPDILLPFHDWCKQALPKKWSSSFISKQWNQINGIYMQTHHCKYFVFDGCQFNEEEVEKNAKEGGKRHILMICVENSNIFLGFKLVSIISLIHFFFLHLKLFFALPFFPHSTSKWTWRRKKIVNKML